jgi:uncharacterized protein GlcG (DUF336 family)
MLIRSLRAPLGALLLLLAAHLPARSQPLPSAHYLPLSVAIEAAQAALAKCTADGFHVSVAVLDAAGTQLVTYHDERSTIHSAYSARQKAYTVLSYAFSDGGKYQPTSDLLKRFEGTETLVRVLAIPGMLPSQGGALIMMGKEIVGAIGVGGSPGGTPDQICANTGLEKIKPHLQ